MRQGQLITIEGIDCSGKTSQVNFIRKWFEDNNIELIITREPGGTKLGENIRSQLLDIDTSVSLETEVLLMFAARQQHIHEVILPALKEGKWVLSDRFTDATYAYQGAGRGVATKKIKVLEEWVQEGLQPSLTILLDAPAEVCQKRCENRDRRDRIESEDMSFFNRVRERYLALAQSNPDRYRIISGEQSIEKVSEQIVNVLDDFKRKVM
ncbi:MAG: dTMP kinase [Neisseriaceae bacterium]|nr:MAG: dTMP kinase [Neisseriaceae bacterium]